MTQEEKLIEFIKKVEVVSSVNNIKYLATDLIPNIPKCVELLYKIINHKTQDELDQFGFDLNDFIDNIINANDFQSMHRPIEGLGQKFESFLKIIAFLKGYERTIYWRGNTHSKGILGTSLHALCCGNLERTQVGKRQNIPQLVLPDRLFNFSGINKELIDFVRERIRNKVHVAQTYSRQQIITYSEKAILIYLLVINDNFKLLSCRFLPEYQHLNRVVNNSEYKNLDSVYVNIFGKDFLDINIQATKVLDVKDILNDIERFDIYSNADDLDEDIDDGEDVESVESNKADQNILELSTSGLSFFLIGDPGAGKSTTFLKILFQNSNKILDGDSLKIPVLLSAREFSLSNGFIAMTKRSLGDNWQVDQLKGGNYLLLVDGLNEIPKQLKGAAVGELKEILKDYPNCSFIFSERKIGFQRYFDMPVYELKPLDDVQIRDFIIKYGKNNGEKIWGQISNNEKLMNLAHNPLMLKMLMSVSKYGEVPANKGRLYDLFVKTIFTREEKKIFQISYELKLSVLSKVCYKIRGEGKISCNKFYFKELLRNALIEGKSNVDLDVLYAELVENFIIKCSQTEDVSFVHESYLEYFAGFALMSNYKVTGTLKLPAYNDNWLEPLELCVGLLDNEEDVTKVVNELCSAGNFSVKNNAKEFLDFSEQDFNADIYIAATVANGIKPYFPKIYQRVEDLLINYLTLWKYLLFEKGLEVIPFSKLFAAVAILNSERLFKIILCNPEWVNLWLYSDTQLVIEGKKLRRRIVPTEDDFYKSAASIFATYAIDISAVFSQLENSLSRYGLFYSVIQRIKELKAIILENTTYRSIKEYYLHNSHADIVVIKRLIMLNCNDVHLYNFEKRTITENRLILQVLAREHLHVQMIRAFLVDQIKTGQYTLKSKVFIKRITMKLFLGGYEHELIEVIEYLLFALNNDSLDYYFEEMLQNIRWENLSASLQEYFLSKLGLTVEPTKRKHKVWIEISNESVGFIDLPTLAQVVIHPSFLLNYKDFIMKIVERLQIDSALLTKFLCRNKLLDSFHSHIPNSHLGVIASNNKEHNNCYLYLFKKTETKELPFQNGSRVGDLVVVDETGRIHPLQFSPELKSRLGFIKGKVVNYDLEKNEGFISPVLSWGKGDCYFSKKSSDVPLRNGMMVEFIPVPNPVKRYAGKFIALNIATVGDL